MSWIDDRRNRPALAVAAGGGLLAFLVGWIMLGISPAIAWIVGWSLPAFALYGIDKRRALDGGWRVPEMLLHTLALVGGVIGAWLGRAVFRHKTRKPVFLVVLVIASLLWGGIAAWALLG